MSLADDLALAVKLAREAGAAIEMVRARGFVAHDKADESPVTEADLTADRIIRRGLEAARPGDAVLSEESLGAKPVPGQALWCVDPLDGTEALVDAAAEGHYVRGYAVQIARLVPAADGHYEPTLGVTYEPRADELCYAVRGGGAFVVQGGVVRGPLRVSDRGPADGATLVSSKRVDPAVRAAFLDSGFGSLGAVRSVGVKVARMILGEAEVYPATHNLSWWDLCAPQIILEEAGGCVTDGHGRRPVYSHKGVAAPRLNGPLLLSNGVCHPFGLQALGARPLAKG